jgi:hypothetical protein
MSGAALQGLSGLLPDPQDTTDTMNEGVLQSKAFDLNSDHSEWGSQDIGYSGTVPLQSPFSELTIYDAGATGDGYTDVDEPSGAGIEVDKTPTTHSATYPRGIIQPSWGNPDAWSDVGEQINLVHSEDLGGPKQYNGFQPSGREQPVNWTADDYLAPNQNILAKAPGQLKSWFSGYGSGRGNSSGAGGSNADPDQGYGVNNTLEEFNTGHSIRNVQHDSMHFDYTNTHGEQNEPFYGRHPVQQAQFDGPDSPYYAMGDIDGANVPYVIGYPTPYVQAPEPTILPAQQGEDVWTSY